MNELEIREKKNGIQDLLQDHLDSGGSLDGDSLVTFILEHAESVGGTEYEKGYWSGYRWAMNDIQNETDKQIEMAKQKLKRLESEDELSNPVAEKNEKV